MLVAQSCLTLCDSWTVAHQAPLSMGYSSQEYSNRLTFPPPGREYSEVVSGAGEDENGISKVTVKTHVGIKGLEMWNHLNPLIIKEI